MVAIFHSKSPKSIPCTTKKANLFQKSHTSSRTETKKLNLDLASTSTSSIDRCLSTSSTTSSKIFYLPSKKSLSNSLIPSLTSIDSISNYQQQHYYNPRIHSLSNIHKNSTLFVKETAISADNELIYTPINKVIKDNNSYQDSLESVNNHKNSIDIQSFKDTIIENPISITPPSTTPTTPTTPTFPSSNDIDALDESLSSIKNSVESNKYLLNSKNTPTSQTTTTIVHSTTSHYTKNNNTDCIGSINHPKIGRSQIINNTSNTNNNNNNNNITEKLLTSTMHSKLFNSSTSIIDSRKDINKDNFSSNDNFDSNYVKESSISISHSKQKYSLKAKRNLYGKHYKISDSNIENQKDRISLGFKSLCINLINDLKRHADSGPFLNSLEDDIFSELNDKKNGNSNSSIKENNSKSEKNDINYKKSSLVYESSKSKHKNNKITKNSNSKLHHGLTKENLDLNIIQRQLEEDKYTTIYSIIYDLQQLLIHCYKNYPEENHVIHRMGKNIENYLLEKIMDMPENFLNELREQCIKDYQYHRKSLKSSSSYPVLAGFLKAIELPMFLEDDLKFKEDNKMITDENSYEDSFEIYSSSRREEQIKECKKKEKEKLCFILGKNNKITIKKLKGKTAEGSMMSSFETSTLSTPFSTSNKKTLVLSLSKKRKYDQLEKKAENSLSSFNDICWNVILKKIPKSYHFDTVSHINKKIRYLHNNNTNTPMNSYPKLLTYSTSRFKNGKSFNHSFHYKNYIFRIKRNYTFHHTNDNFSSSKNFIFYISSDILKNSPWAILFQHFTNKSLFNQNKNIEIKGNTFKSYDIQDLVTPNVSLQSINGSVDSIKEDSLKIKFQKEDSIVETQEKKELDDILMAQHSSSTTTSEFSKEDLMEKEEMKCLMNCDFLPPTPPSSSPPSSPMNITEEDEEIKENESSALIIQNENENEIKIENEMKKDQMDLDFSEKEKEEEKNLIVIYSEEKDKINDIQGRKTIHEIKGKEKEIENGNRNEIENEEENKKENENEKNKILFNNESLPIEYFGNKISQLNPVEWMEAKKSTNAFAEAALNSIKKEQESLTTLLIRQQIQNIIDTQMLIDHLNMNGNSNSLPPIPSYMYPPLNSLDVSLTNIPNLTNMNNSTLPSQIITNIDMDLSTSRNEMQYDVTNDFIDWDKVNEDNIGSSQGVVSSTANLNPTDSSLSFISSSNSSLLDTINSTANLNHLNYNNDDLFNSLNMNLPLSSTSSSQSTDLSSLSSTLTSQSTNLSSLSSTLTSQSTNLSSLSSTLSSQSTDLSSSSLSSTSTLQLTDLSSLPSSSTSQLTDLSSSISSSSSLSSLLDNVNGYNNLGLTGLVSEELNPFVNNTTLTTSSANLSILASKALDLNSSLLCSTTTNSFNQSDDAYNNSIPYSSSKLFANAATTSLMNIKNLSLNSNPLSKSTSLTSSLLMNPLDDSTLVLPFNDVSSNLHLMSSNTLPLHQSRGFCASSDTSYTPPLTSSNSTFKHHHHITSNNLYTTASNIATSLTAASKLATNTNQNKNHHINSNTNINTDILLNESKNTHTSSSVVVPLSTIHNPTALLETLDVPLLKPSFSKENKVTPLSILETSNSLNVPTAEADKKKEIKIKTPTEILNEKSSKIISIEISNPIERVITVPTPSIKSKTIPTLPTTTSDIMFSSGSNESNEVQETLNLSSLLPQENVAIDHSFPSNEVALTPSEFLNPTNYSSCYELLLNLNNNYNEPLISELANHETVENLALENEKSLVNESKIDKDEKKKEFVSKERILNMEKEVSLIDIKKEPIHNDNDSNGDQSFTSLERIEKDVSEGDSVQTNEKIIIKKEDFMEEDPKERLDEIKKIEQLKQKPKRITISLDLSHGRNIRKEEDNKEIEKEEEEDVYMNHEKEEESDDFDNELEDMEKDKSSEEDSSEEGLDHSDIEMEESDDESNNESEEEKFDDNNSEDDFDDNRIEEEEESNDDDDNNIDIDIDFDNDNDNDNNEDIDIDFDNDNDNNNNEDIDYDDDSDDSDDSDEQVISLMEMKRIKQQQQQQQQQQQDQKTSTSIKNSIKINPPLPKIIVHTKKENKSSNKIATNIIINTNSHINNKTNQKKNNIDTVKGDNIKNSKDNKISKTNNINIENNKSNNAKIEIKLPVSEKFIDVQQLELNDITENIFDIESLTQENLIKIQKSILSRSQNKKKSIVQVKSNIGSLLSKDTKEIANKKEKIINLSKLVLKENKNRKMGKKLVSIPRSKKKVRGRNALKIQNTMETNHNKNSNINIKINTNINTSANTNINVNTDNNNNNKNNDDGNNSSNVTSGKENSNIISPPTPIPTPTRGKGRPKGHCGRPRKRWPNDQNVSDSNKNYLYSTNKENKNNKFKVEENGNTLYIKPELKEKSSETIVTQVSVTTTSSVDPITVITSTVPSSVITSTRNSHFYSSSPKQCTYCGSTSTPLWRHGPPESPRLCNSCGVKWKRGKILQSQPSGFPWNSISIDKKTEEFRALMRCITSEKVLKVLGILKTCMTIAMRRQLERGEEVKIDIRNIDSRAWSQLYRYIKCQ